MENERTRQTLDELLAAPPSEAAGRALLKWARGVRSRAEAGEGMMLGLLSKTDVDGVPVALTRAGELGTADAWTELASWLESPPLDAPDLVGADEALGKAVRAKAKGAKVRLAELRWFQRRDDASEAEREEACALLLERVRENDRDAEALHLLGMLTCTGFGIAADPAAAFRLEERAAELGNANALFELHIHYAKGLGVPQDDRAALDANVRAAEAGHYRAMYNMGAFSASGRYVPQDMAKAVDWYERAAEAGSAIAAATLGAMYETGEGVERDADRAVECYDLAEYLGFDVEAFRTSLGL